MGLNPLLQLKESGQSVWLDYLRRSLVTGGALERLVREDAVSGVTSNPSIFQKAIAASRDYHQALREVPDEPALSAARIYEHLAFEDVRLAADILRPVYEASGRRDGFVSLEVSPHLAHNTVGTCTEARRLRKEIDRENVMITVPATREGIPAFETLIAEGIHVNVTLLFSRETYEQVVQAYLRGLETMAGSRRDPGSVASVASFFVSRIDTLIDSLVVRRLERSRSQGERKLLQQIRGRVAVANARLAYGRYRQILSSDRWRRLQESGARPQRLLWAGTGAADPQNSDILYVEELIGPDTVVTLSPATLEAFRDHGRVRPALEEDPDAAEAVLAALGQLDIPIRGVTDRLLLEGVRRFREDFDRMIAAVDSARGSASQPFFRRQTCRVPGGLPEKIEATVRDWRDAGKGRRLWARDASLWTGGEEGKWLGWLPIAGEQLGRLEQLRAFGDEVRRGGTRHLVVLGMGGSSLCPEVLSRTFEPAEGGPELHVLDSTDPAQILSLEERIDLEKSLFIVSSKSGGTLEPNLFKDYFLHRVRERLGPARAPGRFVAVTDPGSPLEAAAARERFRHLFHGVPAIGGRYSALSDFGLIPAAGYGIDVGRFLERTLEMVEACAACVPEDENPGVALGAILGTLASQGRDKVTLITSPGLDALGGWLEQLLAESTGKRGTGLIPVDGEPLGDPDRYADDRLFVSLRLENGADPEQERAIDRLEEAGHPVVRIPVADRYDLGQEFFRWEFATAVAGSILGVNPFDQPDVEASKVASRELTEEYAKRGSFPAERPILEADGLAWFADRRNAADLGRAAAAGTGARELLRAHLGRLGSGDYFALLAWLERKAAHRSALQEIRCAVRDARRVATCLGFGPRFLHSTGQAYKGGPNAGVFLQITCDDAREVPVPGRPFGFGVVKAAQALGDFRVLADRERRLLRVHLGVDTERGLALLRRRIAEALA